MIQVKVMLKILDTDVVVNMVAMDGNMVVADMVDEDVTDVGDTDDVESPVPTRIPIQAPIRMIQVKVMKKRVVVVAMGVMVDMVDTESMEVADDMGAMESTVIVHRISGENGMEDAAVEIVVAHPIRIHLILIKRT
jgi:hypothetical protein